MSAFKAAFEKVGYKLPAERLWDAGVVAWTTAGGNLERGRDELFKLIERDAELLLELFKPWHRVAVQKLLEGVSQEAREEERRRQVEEAAKELRSQNTNDRQRPAVVPSRSGPKRIENQSERARPAPPSNIGPRAVHEIIRNKSYTVRQSLLDTFRIQLPAAYGAMPVKIGDCTPTEALSWVGATERDIKFVRLLTQNLPAGEKIRKHMNDPDVIDSLYAEAMRS